MNNKDYKFTEDDKMFLKIVLTHDSSIVFDEEEFLDLLKQSLSLNISEKKRVLDAVITLSQFQIDELKKVFVEEREKFRELSKDNPDDINKLLKKQREEWNLLGDIYRNEKKKNEKNSEDQQKIDDIKESLGL